METTLEQIEITQNPVLFTKQKVSFEDYLAMDERNIEWVDGEIIKTMSAASYFHEEEFRWLMTVTGLFVSKNNLGKIIGSRFAMRLEMVKRGREPDLIFVANENLDKIKPTFLDGAADLVVEIISPESFGRDRGEKFLEYEAAGIKEYWLIDVERKQAEFYVLDESGRYQLAQIADGVYHSPVIKGFWLKVEWLWNLPNELEVLKELQVI